MYEDIKEQFKEVIRFSQNIADPQIDHLFDSWLENKSKFIKYFNNSLIYEHPFEISFNLEEQEKLRRVKSFAHLINKSYEQYDLADFIMLNINSFFENKITELPEKYKNIPKTTKLVKAFKYFVEDEAILRNLQDEASLLIQENKVCGRLCFSVHPLDFLSLSENTHGWRSCHSLDGDYRAGNLSYLIDNTTFIVYLKSDKDVNLPNFGNVKWNSKKWRVLIYAGYDDSFIFAGRQYPFSSTIGLETMLRVYNNLIYYHLNRNGYNNWSNFYIDSANDIELYDRYALMGRSLISINKIVKNAKNSLQFNDVLNSTTYRYPYYATLKTFYYLTDPNYITEKYIEVGGAVKCLECGKGYIEDENTMRCYDCELKYQEDEEDEFEYCECCGA